VIVCDHIENGAAPRAAVKKRCGQLLNRIGVLRETVDAHL
jgi:hypothetical protein